MKQWRLWLGILISTGCLFLAIRGVDVMLLRQTLRGVQVPYLLLALLLSPWLALLRAVRWQGLLDPVTAASTQGLFHVLNIGYLLNNFLPFRLGDFLRAYFCAELGQCSAVGVLSTIVVERFADTLVIVLLLLALVPAVALPQQVLRGMLIAGAAAVTGLLLLLAARQRRTSVLARLQSLSARVPLCSRLRLADIFAAATDGFEAIARPRRALRVVGLSLAIWLSAALQFELIIRGMHLAVAPIAGLLVLCVTSLGMIIPSSPGYVGVFEYLTVVSLSLLGIGQDAALGTALVLHASLYLSTLVLGLLSMWIQGYGYSHLRAAWRQSQLGS